MSFEAYDAPSRRLQIAFEAFQPLAKLEFLDFYYPRNEMRTPAATAEPITPEMFEAMQ